jgi:hypothetical protein
MIASLLPDFPCGNKVPFLASDSAERALALVGVLDSFSYDWVQRIRQGSTSLNYFVIEECPVAKPDIAARLALACQRLGLASMIFSPTWARVRASGAASWMLEWAVTDHERMRLWRRGLDSIWEIFGRCLRIAIIPSRP